MSAFDWSRRGFLSLGLAALVRGADDSVVFPVEFRKPGPYEAQRKFIDAGADEFACEREAMEIERLLARPEALVLAADFEGVSPEPVRLRAVDSEISIADFGASGDFVSGLMAWLAGARSLRFIPLAGHVVRFEAEGRTGHWHMEWAAGKLRRFRPLDETRVSRVTPWFVDRRAHV